MVSASNAPIDAARDCRATIGCIGDRVRVRAVRAFHIRRRS
ncbi:hypothetical protein AZ78_2803 [Lysobacter capsici AZ78]|uniref:Uncharacterized protein n=1 Tax=Lysobacter capsici AZ78 TaxID=1444315 RepID=A0A108U9X9_9GAMM|nr:hypothetical protein AZ78_2803 [Lysobacter capsici AZ78]